MVPEGLVLLGRGSTEGPTGPHLAPSRAGPSRWEEGAPWREAAPAVATIMEASAGIASTRTTRPMLLEEDSEGHHSVAGRYYISSVVQRFCSDSVSSSINSVVFLSFLVLTFGFPCIPLLLENGRRT